MDKIELKREEMILQVLGGSTQEWANMQKTQTAEGVTEKRGRGPESILLKPAPPPDSQLREPLNSL